MRTQLFHGALASACLLVAVLSTSAARADLLPPDSVSCTSKASGDPCQVCSGTTVFDGVCTSTTCSVGGGPDSSPTSRPCTRCLGKDGSLPPTTGGPCPDAGTGPADDAGGADTGGGGDGGASSPTVSGGGCTLGRASELGAWGLALLVPAISFLTRRRKSAEAKR